MDNPNPKQKPEYKAPTTDQAAPPEPTRAAPPEGRRPVETPDRPLRLFEDAYYQYFKEMQESARQSAESYQGAYQDYLQRAKEVYDEGGRRLEEAAQAYLRDLQSAQESENPQEGVLKAYYTFLQAQQTAFGADDYLKLTDAHKDYRNTLTDLSQSKTAGGSSQDAFRNYLHAVKRAWAQIDPDALDVYSLAAISGSILAVTSQACRH
jgi:uncharacterized phage infection (PIP) family protein YhgE